jgi:hypothetical protein
MCHRTFQALTIGNQKWISSKRCTAEFIGTFWLVFRGCGSAVLAAAFPEVGIGLLGVSFAFGLTVLTMAYAIGHISGLPFEPGSLGRSGGREVVSRSPSWPRTSLRKWSAELPVLGCSI